MHSIHLQSCLNLIEVFSDWLFIWKGEKFLIGINFDPTRWKSILSSRSHFNKGIVATLLRTCLKYDFGNRSIDLQLMLSNYRMSAHLKKFVDYNVYRVYNGLKEVRDQISISFSLRLTSTISFFHIHLF